VADTAAAYNPHPMAAAHVRDVLLAPALTPSVAAELLAPYGFRDPGAADRNLQSIAQDPVARGLLAEILPELLAALADSVDPDAALNHLERFVRSGGGAQALLGHLRADPRTIEVLARAFGASGFMAEILIRNPAWFYWLVDPAVLGRSRTRAEIGSDLDHALSSLHSEARRRDVLRTTRRREILQIGVRDLLRLAPVDQTLGALSALAGALIEKACAVSEAGLREERGLALPDPGARPPAFAVLGMGKLGGDELNFSSDVDLVYVHGDDEGASGPASPYDAAFYEALAQRVTAALSELTPEGYVYRVDLRLRPEGRVGPLAPSLSACAEYYEARGATWERLALLRAWPVAGDQELGRRFVERVRPFVYGPFGREALADLRRVKIESDRRVAGRDETHRNVKLGLGGIREIELVAQALAVRHGSQDPALRVRNTKDALHALRGKGLVSAEEHWALDAAYVFLRDVENKLQMAADAQTHSLPQSPEALRRCGRSLGYRDKDGVDPGEALMRDYRAHTEATHRVFEAVFEGPRLVEAGK
jgi:glutamate-ammonia-ligase adenylyltransferase